MKYVNTSNFNGVKDDQLTILGYSASLWGSHIHGQAESDCTESGRATYSLYFSSLHNPGPKAGNGASHNVAGPLPISSCYQDSPGNPDSIGQPN